MIPVQLSQEVKQTLFALAVAGAHQGLHAPALTILQALAGCVSSAQTLASMEVLIFSLTGDTRSAERCLPKEKNADLKALEGWLAYLRSAPVIEPFKGVE